MKSKNVLFIAFYILSFVIIGKSQTLYYYGNVKNFVGTDFFTGETFDAFIELKKEKIVILYFSRLKSKEDYKYHMSLINQAKSFLGDNLVVAYIEANEDSDDDFLRGIFTDPISDFTINTPKNDLIGIYNDFYISQCAPNTIYYLTPDNKMYKNHSPELIIPYVNKLIKVLSLKVSSEISLEECDRSSIKLNVNGAFQSYSYKWSSGHETKDIYNLAPGSYQVTITDLNNDERVFGPWVIDQMAISMNTSKTILNHNICAGQAVGEIKLIVDGGGAPYKYNWSTSSTEASLKNLSAGTYTVTIEDQKQCKIIRKFEITEPKALNLRINTTDEFCKDGLAQLNINPSGGVAPYKYYLDDIEHLENNINSLKSGQYKVRVVDHNLCSEEKLVRIQNIQKVRMNLRIPDNINCFFEEVTLIAGESTSSNVNWIWSTKDGNITHGHNTNAATVSKAGTYTIKASLSDGSCERVENIVIQEQKPIQPKFRFEKNDKEYWFFDESEGDVVNRRWTFGDHYTSFDKNPIHIFDEQNEFYVCLEVSNDCSVRNICKLINNTSSSSLNISDSEVLESNCYGSSNSSIKVNAQGGVGPYIYKWNNGSTKNEIANLVKGVYTVTITDADFSTISSFFFVSEPDEIKLKNVDIQNTEFAQSNGSIKLTVQGGKPKYFFKWSNGLKGSSIHNLSPGSYTVSVADSYGCEKMLGPFEVKATTQFEDVNALNLVIVFPNPVNDYLLIDNLIVNQEYEVSITNLLGNVIYENAFSSKSKHERIKLDNFHNGVYCINIHHKNNLVARKFTKI